MSANAEATAHIGQQLARIGLRIHEALKTGDLSEMRRMGDLLIATGQDMAEAADNAMAATKERKS